MYLIFYVRFRNGAIPKFLIWSMPLRLQFWMAQLRYVQNGFCPRPCTFTTREEKVRSSEHLSLNQYLLIFIFFFFQFHHLLLEKNKKTKWLFTLINNEDNRIYVRKRKLFFIYCENEAPEILFSLSLNMATFSLRWFSLK